MSIGKLSPLHERPEGSRPVAIMWRLEHALPAALLQDDATFAGG